jgi:hypothetical protein
MSFTTENVVIDVVLNDIERVIGLIESNKTARAMVVLGEVRYLLKNSNASMAHDSSSSDPER